MNRIRQAFTLCIAAVAILTNLWGCSGNRPEIENGFSRPDYSGYMNPLPAGEYIGFDFYIQATSYMAGFINDTDDSVPRGDRPFVKILPILSDTAEKWEFQDKASRNYYRFDYDNLDADMLNEPYYISRIQFEDDAAADPEFYSLSWYLSQEGRSPERFKSILTDGGNAGYYDNSYYLSKTLSNLKKNNISVVVTDMIDSKLNTDAIISALSSVFIADNSMAVSIFAIKSPFYGAVYTMEDGLTPNGSRYEGERPFYILVLGVMDKNAGYCSDLKGKFGQAGIIFDYQYISSRKSGGVTANGVDENGSPLEVTFGDEAGNGEYGIQEMYRNKMGKVEKANLTTPDTLYYQIKMKQSDGQAIINVEAPLKTIGMPCDPNTDFNIQFWDSYDIKWSIIPSDKAAAVTKGSSTAVLKGNDPKLELRLVLNTETLDDLGDGVDSKFKINAVVTNQKSLEPPEWLNNYAYTGGPVKDISSADVYGSSTIGLSNIFTSLLYNADKYGKEKSIIADILVYIALTH